MIRSVKFRSTKIVTSYFQAVYFPFVSEHFSAPRIVWCLQIGACLSAIYFIINKRL